MMVQHYAIEDQNGVVVGRGVNRSPDVVHAWRDENDTIWLPPTAWAYFAVCRTRDRLQREVEALRGIKFDWVHAALLIALICSLAAQS